MKRFCLLVLIVLSSAGTPANAQQEPKFQFPKDGNGLLEYCGQIVNILDSPSLRVDETKLAWCVGYIQANQDLIEKWRITMALEIMAAKQDGKPAPYHLRADDDFGGTCFPVNVSVAQIGRVLVRWLRDHPERLHESKSLLIAEALKSAFPCQAVTKEAVKPAVKP
jgi:hypothetical protein